MYGCFDIKEVYCINDMSPEQSCERKEDVKVRISERHQGGMRKHQEAANPYHLKAANIYQKKSIRWYNNTVAHAFSD